MPADPDRRHDNASAAAFLTEHLGTRITEKTVTNWRYEGRGPQGWEYLGQTPVIRESRLIEYVGNALQSEPTSRRNARRAAQRQAITEISNSKITGGEAA